ncbi:digeranylgeranylglyceryl phosphate synthase [Methanobrevibacter ruminantium M1]|uniref:Digeranylgeranylglyceryl phosphate synthase n=1 Tax=Methanobrevibacter ruminantium (strain ATCC 35063 / DSM 1093 / JCM 13430 / OCM 146 / M1) TaxID=634498 RepID=D3DZQ7_METRM|nr:UbiA family prenyltransferase [Methanobrevibacter ruminantium]ADC47735.1 digeranylgeranylglyceryl phosphate synthase [Methanobrevibacter ruminantium M1]
MNPYLEIIRPGNAVMAAISVVLMMIVGHYYDLPIILCAVIVFVCTGAGNTINDVFDYKIDEINKPNRPIPSGRISLKNARNYSYLLFAIGIILSFVIDYMINSIWPSVIVVPAVVIMYLYARNLKAMPLIGNITVATLTGFCFVIAGTVIACATSSLRILFISIYLGLFALFMTLAREIVKDMEDIEGDKLEGARTFPILYGKKIPSIVSIILIVVTTLMCPVLYIFGIFNVFYMIVMIVPICMFLYCAYSLKLNPPEEVCAKVSKNLKIAMLISFVAFVLGSFDWFSIFAAL